MSAVCRGKRSAETQTGAGNKTAATQRGEWRPPSWIYPTDKIKETNGSEPVRMPISIILLDPYQLSKLIDLDKSVEIYCLRFKRKLVEHWEVSNFTIFICSIV